MGSHRVLNKYPSKCSDLIVRSHIELMGSASNPPPSITQEQDLLSDIYKTLSITHNSNSVNQDPRVKCRLGIKWIDSQVRVSLVEATVNGAVLS